MELQKLHVFIGLATTIDKEFEGSITRTLSGRRMPFGKAKDLSPIDQLTHFEKDPNFFIVFPARRRTNHGLTYTKNFSGGAAPQTPRFVRPSASSGVPRGKGGTPPC